MTGGAGRADKVKFGPGYEDLTGKGTEAPTKTPTETETPTDPATEPVTEPATDAPTEPENYSSYG
jgi:hypothetical protein